MKKNTLFTSISIKLGLLFSGVFLILLIILGSILYGVFTNLFVDFVTNDLVVNGNNHAKVLGDNYSHQMIDHIISMEKGGTTNVIITDKSERILGSSVPPDNEIKKYLKAIGSNKFNAVITNDWNHDPYIVTVSAIANNKGYIYMFYPTAVLKDAVFVIKMLIIASSLGIVLLAFGIVGILSRKITKPLLIMKDVTNKMALGKYQQKIPSGGNDEVGQLAHSIQQLGEQLQFYEDSRNEFLSAVSHELRTPLTYIKGYSDILSKGMIQTKEEQAEFLSIINRESKRISYMVDDLFEMSKLNVNRFQLKKEASSINTIVEKVAAILKPAAEKKGLRLHTNLSVKIPDVSLDQQRMEQVIYNLAENAIKYTDHGTVSIHTDSQNNCAIIEISDTGIGIPQQEIPKIWEQFYRIEKSRARKTGGTGLGLYIVKQIIDAHDGEIKVKSAENEGTTFTIHLPVKDSN